MAERRRSLLPFYDGESRRLAAFFAVVYFAQGVWGLPTQALKMTLKDQALSASAIETFFALATLPWLLKPVYGLISDFVPIRGQRRRPYLLITCAVASASAFWLSAVAAADHGLLLPLFAAMTLGLAFTDVLADGLMVDAGRPRGLTGSFQAIQWASIKTASVVVGVTGGYLAATRDLETAFTVAGLFPLLSLVIVALFVREERRPAQGELARGAAEPIRQAFRSRDLWAVAAFIFFWTFSPSFDTALLFHQTDVLGFGQELIGGLSAVGSVGGVAGALVYPILSRRIPLRRIINLAIGIGVAGTLLYLAYRDTASAVAIEAVFGGASTVATLAFLELAAKAAPQHVEATFFALLMSVYYAGTRVSGIVGGLLYDAVGYPPLVLISAAITALAWLLVPWLGIDGIEARALAAVREAGDGGERRLP